MSIKLDCDFCGRVPEDPKDIQQLTLFTMDLTQVPSGYYCVGDDIQIDQITHQEIYHP